MSEHFYRNIPTFSAFEELTNFGNYQSVPEDWVVIITDVVGSTKAIENGRYKDVNTIGAATIVSLNNAMEGLKYPFVFGGDGATAVIPRSKVEAAQKELSGLSQLAEQNFALLLRVGMVGVDELVASGAKLQVAKYLLSSGVELALFQGGGLSLAEEKIKNEEETYSIIFDAHVETDLTSLSCRWKPLQSENGKILSLLVSSHQGDASQNYKEFLAQFIEIIGSLNSVNPASKKTLKVNSSLRSFINDVVYQTSIFARLKRILGLIKIYLSINLGLFDRLEFLNNYTDSLPAHSDFHKFDEMVRMVIDVTTEQIEQIRVLCEQMYQEKKICYGIHLSDHALMTCVVPSLDNGEHIHFIDGGAGGYTMAAKQLKGQIKLG